MLGSAILVLPVLDQGQTTVTGVFPGGKSTRWYDWYTGKEEDRGKHGENVTVDAPLGHIPIYIKGGSIIPLQQPAYTTSESRKNPFELVLALDENSEAIGQLYLDDGESLEPEDMMLLKVC
jgi:alpha-glucosidase